MSMNNNSNSNTPVIKNAGLGNPSGVVQMQMQMPQSVSVTQNQPAPHLLAQSRVPPHFPGHFQLSEPQTLALGAQGPSHSHFQPHQQPQSFHHFQNSAANNANTGASAPAASTPSVVASAGVSAKKVLQRQPSRATGQGQVAGPMLKTMELTPAARKRKRKLSEKHIPEKVAAILPESALYTQLLEFESRVDAALVRMKTDILESLKNPQRIQKTLRLYVFNTFANQTGASPQKEHGQPPSWSLRIFGRILNNKTPAVGMQEKPSPSDPKFSSFFKKITVYLDQSLYADNHVILWESSRSPVLHDGFEVRRKGDKEFTAIIRLEMNYVPEKYKLSPALQDVLGIEMETRPRILAAIWQYVKARKLQLPDETSSFMCDPALRKVFGEEKLKFSTVSQKIDAHLTIPQPIHLEHKVKLSGSSPTGNTCYDILVDVPFTPQKEMLTYLANLGKNKEIDVCDEAISAAIKKIHEHNQRRAFFLGFSQSPYEFINALVASQARDLKLVSGDSVRDEENERRSEFYHQSWIEDAVIRYLNRKAPPGQ
ncbi:SWI/SNF complex component SNF12 homolog [Ipomoea triloba]|uniref:SWI/SNF complex component SNF12 homolog n=1 Tax=Ipomoea triloba TaxID=35885 RepID=UPI00125E95A0|nr:SWI/SNF complex component SNF12 homolog [Ipomoea triloba]XP_031109449.1 SWI/SNF complex component SNF12 homolog [Ipomoea triloba]